MNNLAFQIYGSKKTGIFQSTWDTTKTSTGSSATNQITLPLISGGTYNFWIDWGDGSTTNVTSYSQIYSGETLPRTHTYTTAGIYTVRITGVCTGWYFNNTGDRLKILSISSWGILKLGTVGGGCFYGCANLNLSSVTDVLNLTGTTQLGNCFRLCTTLTAVNRMNEWDLSTVTRIDGMFLDATNFNQNIGNWNVSAVTNMGSVFANCILFNQNLGSWNTISVTSMSNMFQKASVFNNGLAPGVTGTMNWNTSNVITMASMFINALAFNQNISTWNTIKVTSMASMFSRSDAGTYNFNQNIGAWNVSSVTDFSGMFQNTTLFNNGESSDINNWTLKTTGTISMASMFSVTLAFNQPLDNWNVSNVVNMDRMFYLASKFNNGYASGDGIGNQLTWNTSTCTNMNGMFNSAVAFNSNLGTGTTPWNVSKVTIFASMFNGATKFTNGDDSAPINNWSINTVSNVVMNSMFQSAVVFDRPIGSWNMTKVINASSMFNTASKFNQPLSNWERAGSTMGNNTSTAVMFNSAIVFNEPIGSWNVSNVTDMNSMFREASVFNQPIGSWNVSNVTSMISVFYNAISFNQPLDNWERAGSTTGNVTDMNGMFRGATAFNGLVDTWNVSKVTNMQAMFWNASRFNKPLANWERVGSTLANVTLFSNYNIYVGMFGLATDFNQPIGNWNVSKVTRMNYMFYQASSFNQPIDSWDVSSVWDMEGMFNNASSFNKPLGSWNLSKISNMTLMFEGANTFNNGLAAGLSGTFTWNINTISDINMSRMFANLGVFNQNIGAWNVSKVTNFTNFMLGKTPSTYSSTNLDAIYNGWSTQTLQHTTPITISFGTAKYSSAGTAGRLTLTSSPNNWAITDGLLTVSGTSNNGGLIRVTTSAAHGFTTGNVVYIYGVGGTTNANGTWTVTVISTTIIQLQGSTYNSAWTSGGNIILG